jgi:hypothetical protein
VFAGLGLGGVPNVEYLLAGAGSLILIGGRLFAAAAAARRRHDQPVASSSAKRGKSVV